MELFVATHVMRMKMPRDGEGVNVYIRLHRAIHGKRYFNHNTDSTITISSSSIFKPTSTHQHQQQQSTNNQPKTNPKPTIKMLPSPRYAMSSFNIVPKPSISYPQQLSSTTTSRNPSVSEKKNSSSSNTNDKNNQAQVSVSSTRSNSVASSSASRTERKQQPYRQSNFLLAQVFAMK